MPNELITRSERIAAEIRAEMAKKKITVNGLANQVDIPISTLRRSVNGSRSFTIDELFVITRVLEVEPAELVARTKDEAPRQAS
ncbi:helix-turn-helix domain-containing protein [Corynebacterium sanguinis]|uniref:helix-turn-helix domain-containing protein n=1 Tax=Corynebacterium sanguinis TaxID=2594913 RepID=UPI0021A43ECF|nr:helix-turn-helix transcriptional regulator [Corynebacterium sanguinis]MCT1463371.1 helix-turn-helix transcriptional regulator [Corynebacterium sanguinis]MCT2329983.1 helix-turn-helix transcriptional regulator [Corynebacterium sanguinis]